MKCFCQIDDVPAMGRFAYYKCDGNNKYSDKSRCNYNIDLNIEYFIVDQFIDKIIIDELKAREAFIIERGMNKEDDFYNITLKSYL